MLFGQERCQSGQNLFVATPMSGQEPLLTWWSIDKDRGLSRKCLSRARFFEMASQAAASLKRLGISKGERVVHAFSRNHYLDLAYRQAATRVGAVPVTINWEADTLERIIYKIKLTSARLLIHDSHFSQAQLLALKKQLPRLAILDVEDWEQDPQEEVSEPIPLSETDEKIIIFTSGTTGQPKGVSHNYASYRANAATFNQFWELAEDQPFCVVITSALHHANATAISDWCLSQRGAQLHLLSRYSTAYWEVLAGVAEECETLLIAPVVSRHFDFLASLDEQAKLPLDELRLRKALEKVTFLIGSAPVGPTTVKRICHYTGRLPVVRFGSSETCLQVMAIPPHMPEQVKWTAFQRGWAKPQRLGYYVGRPHPESTWVKVVAEIERDAAGFMEEVPQGRPGYLVTRGDNLMTAYVGDEQTSRAVSHDGWYLGLQDIGFYLINEEDGQPDFYWMSRQSTLLIKGGANYSYEQINAELLEYLSQKLEVHTSCLEVAVVGLRLSSEHEDSTCVTVCLDSKDSAQIRRRIGELLLGSEAKALSKGARPDRLHFGNITRNFKGAVVTEQLKQPFIEPDPDLV